MNKLAKREENHESDDSEDEIIESRIGEVPHSWYKKEHHFGYDHKGNKVDKTDGISGKSNKKLNSLIHYWNEQKIHGNFYVPLQTL